MSCSHAVVQSCGRIAISVTGPHDTQTAGLQDKKPRVRLFKLSRQVSLTNSRFTQIVRVNFSTFRAKRKMPAKVPASWLSRQGSNYFPSTLIINLIQRCSLYRSLKILLFAYICYHKVNIIVTYYSPQAISLLSHALPDIWLPYPWQSAETLVHSLCC